MGATVLKPKPTLSEIQAFVAVLCEERGFEKETVAEVFLVLIEEFGELAKAVRKANGQKYATDSVQRTVEDEAADVFWLLLDLCNRLDIDLEQAFRAKELKNQQREWK